MNLQRAYTRTCAEIGRNPEKPFSRKLHLRTNPEIHRRVSRFIQISTVVSTA
ncbi:MAG: toxin-antitoxin system HicB family antitoxin [Prochlorothrix sp.]